MLPADAVDAAEGSPMKLVTAVIKPFKLDEVRAALSDIGVPSMTVSEARGYGRQLGRCELFRGAEYQGDFMPKVMIEIVISDALLAKTVETIRLAAKTDLIGDGKIFVSVVERLVRIRTGEIDDAAL